MVRVVRNLPDVERHPERLKGLAAPDRWTQAPQPSKPADGDEVSFDHFRARWWPAEKITLPGDVA